MAPIRQASFGGGEFSPDLYGRDDLAKYPTALRRMRNFYINKRGQAVSRPGLLHVNQTKNNTSAVRLVPMSYLDGQGGQSTENYLLEFGANYIRVYQGGNNTVTGDISTPYAAVDLPRLKFTQSGDTLYITHSSYAPRALFHWGPTNFSLSMISFTPPQAYLINSTDAWVGNLPATDATHVARGWSLYVSAVYLSSLGELVETLPGQIGNYSTDGGVTFTSLPATFFVGDDRPISIHCTAGTLPNTIKGFLFYRGIGDVIGLVGTRDVAGVFIDHGLEPDYSKPPRSGRNPFVSSTGITYFHSTPLFGQTTDYPSTVTFFEDRLAFGGTPSRPAGLDLSAAGDYYNFDQPPLIPNNATALEYDLASRKREEIRSLVGMLKLLAFTSQSIWAVGGSGAPLSISSVDAKVQSEVGATWLEPVVVEETALFERARGSGVRGVKYDFAQGGFKTQDISVYAQHFLDGFTILAWAYAAEPDSVVWAVRSDGKLLSLTFSPEHEMLGWALHETDGTFFDVCVVHFQGRDQVYFVVQRQAGNGSPVVSIEVFSDLRVNTLKSNGTVVTSVPICVDGAKLQGGPTATIFGTPAMEGRTDLVGVADGVVVRDLTCSGGAVAFPDNFNTAVVGFGYECLVETMDPPGAAARTSKKVVNRIFLELKDSAYLSAGPDEYHLSDWVNRDTSDGYGFVPLFSGAIDFSVDGAWDTDSGRVVVVQKEPLPLTILSITREVDRGGE
jgi:hypothetical protein